VSPRAFAAIMLPVAGTADGSPAVETAGAVNRLAADAEYSALFRSEFARVARTVSLIVHDRERAEDITQDAFVQLLRHWPKVSGYERPDAWVRRVAIRLAVRAVRRDKLWAMVGRQIPVAAPLGPRDLDVVNAVRRLPGMQRAAVVLFYYEDRPIVEIADLLGCAEATARVHLHRGRRRLAEILGEEVDDAS
jgi:DNA-directed RNA polymerase specialized sigma24 family protein